MAREEMDEASNKKDQTYYSPAGPLGEFNRSYSISNQVKTLFHHTTWVAVGFQKECRASEYRYGKHKTDVRENSYSAYQKKYSDCKKHETDHQVNRPAEDAILVHHRSPPFLEKSIYRFLDFPITNLNQIN